MTVPISYVPLEGNFVNSVTGGVPTFNTENPFFSSASFLYTLFFIVIIVAASFRYVYAGMLRLPGSETGIRESKEEFKRVTYGLLGVLGLWLILATFNKDMLTGDVGLSALKANRATTATQNPTNTPTQTGNGTVANSGSHTYAERVADHNRVALALAPIKTNHNNTPCTEAEFAQKGTIPPCTSLAYLPQETIQLLLNLNSSCHCSITVTGGTEPNHISHGEGLRAVDLRLTGPRGDSNNSDPLYVYIKSIATNKLGGNSKCFERYVWHTFTFCDEKPPNDQHFHVD